MRKHILLYLFVFSPLSLCSAQDSLLVRNYQYVKHDDPWLTTRNAAALTRFAAPNIAEASVSLSLAKGGLTRYYESPSVLQADVAVEAFYRLSRRTVVYGDISYDNYSGDDMTGSAWINPIRKPFDIAEATGDNAGRKHRDTYRLAGAVGVDVWKGYALGVRLDYTAANYAKYKDLRHKNKLMDLSLSAGFYAPLTAWLSLGADYVYHRNTESLTFSTYGKNEDVYRSLINYGAFFGRVEQFGNGGYTDKSREMPLFEDSHGADFQVELRPMRQLTAIGSFGFSKGDGYYGRRSPYTATYTQHDRRVMTAALSLIYTPVALSDKSDLSDQSDGSNQSDLRPCSRHRLDLSFRNEKLANRAETFRELSNASGAYYYEYYAPVPTADKQWQDFSLTYTAQLGIVGETPAWELSAGWQWSRQQQLGYLFPFYRYQDLITRCWSAGATHNRVCRCGVWSFSLEGAFKKGSGSPYVDGTYITPDAQQEAPATEDAFLYSDYQYLTSAQYRIGGSVQYAFIFPGTRLKTHARVSLSHSKANETYVLSPGCDRTQAIVTLGCNF
jgi:hypothetical protein